MAYTPNVWDVGDVITPQKMNHIETGISEAAQSGGGALICGITVNNNTSYLDKTVQEIYDAIMSGTPVFIRYQYGTLGASGTGTYISNTYLAPVIRIYGYTYTEAIRIVASKPSIFDSKWNKYYLFSPGVVIFSASEMDSYPEFFTSVYTNQQYVDSGELY